MAFSAGTIIAQLKLNTKNFSGGIKTAQSDLKSFGTSLVNVKNVLAGTFAAGLTVGAFKMADMGGQARDLRQAFDRLAAQSGTSSKRVVRDVQSITGSLSRRQIAEAANMLELLGVGMENTAKLTEIARAAAISLGQSVPYMLESIATGTARQSKLWLDNLGILIDVEEANKKYAATLGKLSSEMSDTERRAAFLNAVLAKGDDIVKKVGVEADAASEPTRSLAAAMSDLKESLSIIANQSLAGVFSDLAKGLGDFAHAIESNKGTFWTLRALNIKGALMGDASGSDFLRRAEYSAEAFGFTGPTTPPPTPPPTPPSGGLGFRQEIPAMMPPEPPDIDWSYELADGIKQSADAMAILNSEMDIVGSLMGGLGDAVEAFGKALVQGRHAGKAFAGAMLQTLGSVMSQMGDLFIGAGIGFQALHSLSGPLAIFAGIMLKAAAGIVKEHGSQITPGPFVPGVPTDQSIPSAGGFSGGGESTATGNLTVVVNGDFIGDRIWVQRLIDRINHAQRRYGNVQVEAV